LFSAERENTHFIIRKISFEAQQRKGTNEKAVVGKSDANEKCKG